MDVDSISNHKSQFLTVIPEMRNYIDTFRTINKRWGFTITTGMIEAGNMSSDASRMFGPLIADMKTTKLKYSDMQVRLVDAILLEMTKKAVLEITDAAKFTINILKRNLFERTADVGYLATDEDIVRFLEYAPNEDNEDLLKERSEEVRERLAQYRYEYTVYNEIIILDADGNIRANYDPDNNVKRSKDPLLRETLKVDLHDKSYEDKYIETYRATDLKRGRGEVLIYSQKIENRKHETLGTLCLCFDFEDEMNSIFRDLEEGNSDMIVAVLNSEGRVISSNNTVVLPVSQSVPVDLESDYRLMKFNGELYLVSTVATDGYQGFYGLTWYGMAMIRVNSAFKMDESLDLDSATIAKLQHFSLKLLEIKNESENLLDAMKLDSINGQIKAAKFHAQGFVELLHYVNSIGEEIDGLFLKATNDLQKTIVTSLFNDVEFRAFQANNIADRNLYERANDVCWWALTPLFRSYLAKHYETGIDEGEKRGLRDNLQYINDLYTPYLRLLLADTEGKVLAVSNPPGDLEERFEKEDMKRGQDFVGMELNQDLVKKALSLSSSKDYCVSDFEPTFLYGERPTYIYSTAVRNPENNRPVGVIQIVFDSEPQFKAMLMDVLPKDEKKSIVPGSFALFADRKKKIISSTTDRYPAGSVLDLDSSYFSGERGERKSTIVELDSASYALGFQVSNGYREYKGVDGYVNDVVSMIFIPM